VLRVGLTGGIGAGKSTVGRRLAERGAYRIDADELAREVVARGTDGLADVVATFGPDVLGPDGELDRPAMAARVFSDPAALDRLNAIIHPRVGARSAELLAVAEPDAVVVQEIPLLVENELGAAFQLVIGVGATAEERTRRLVSERGMAEGDVRARIDAQADDNARRAACDVWLDNSGNEAALLAEVDRLWDRRLAPFESNLRLRQPADEGFARVVPPDPLWPPAAARLAARVAAVAGDHVQQVDHVGPTAVPDVPARDVVDLQLSVPSLAAADAVGSALDAIGFPRVAEVNSDVPRSFDPDPAQWRKRLHAAADPGRPAELHVRVVGSATWRFALLLRDWLRADEDARAEYAALDGQRDAEAWLKAAWARMLRWSAQSGWRPALRQVDAPTRPAV
jgi:dephospho-CoA kinase